MSNPGTPFTAQVSNHWEAGQWEVDTHHDTIIAVGNAAVIPSTARITFFHGTGQGNYQVEKLLQPDEQLWLDMGKLIRNQVPDKDGKTIPSDVRSGTYEVRTLSNKPTEGPFEGKLVVDKAYGHAVHTCAICCGYYMSYMGFDPLNLLVGGSDYQEVWATDSCSSYDFEITEYFSNWGTGNTQIATASGRLMHGVAVGATTNFTNGRVPKPAPQSDYCPTYIVAPSGGVNVTPTISGPNTVWWFNGQNPDPSSYPTSITLTSSAGSVTTWSVTQNSALVTLSNTSGAQTSVSSSGSSFSSQQGDVKIIASANGVDSQPFAITTRRPFRLVNPVVNHLCDISFGYETDISYEIQDQLFTPLPADIPYNEHFVTGAVQDNPQGNWASYGLPAEVGGIALSSPSGSVLIDEITGPGVNSSPSPIPLPVCVGDSTQQEHWGQEFGVGTQTPGGGVRVQRDNIVRFTNHAEHQNVFSPPQ